MNFSSKILKWYDANKRDLPWRLTDNPYVIWVAEVIFQQTRINQGLPYFHAFLDKFPSVEALAAANEEEVLKKWQGLGYYSRARNLQFSAKFVVNELGGIMPSTYEGLIKLKGVGPYIAAEVASVCSGEVVAAVDGNVQRVLSRYFGIADAVNSTKGMKIIQALANAHISATRPGDFNQALMDMGSGICTPKSPNCEPCVLSDSCWAKQQNKQGDLPVKEKKVKIRNRYFNYLLKAENSGLYLKKRAAGDVWQGLFEPYLVESEGVLSEMDERIESGAYELYSAKRVLSHQRIYIKFWVVSADSFDYLGNAFEWVNFDELDNYPVPKSIEQLFLSMEFKSLFK